MGRVIYGGDRKLAQSDTIIPHLPTPVLPEYPATDSPMLIDLDAPTWERSIDRISPDIMHSGSMSEHLQTTSLGVPDLSPVASSSQVPLEVSEYATSFGVDSDSYHSRSVTPATSGALSGDLSEADWVRTRGISSPLDIRGSTHVDPTDSLPCRGSDGGGRR